MQSFYRTIGDYVKSPNFVTFTVTYMHTELRYVSGEGILRSSIKFIAKVSKITKQGLKIISLHYLNLCCSLNKLNNFPLVYVMGKRQYRIIPQGKNLWTRDDTYRYIIKKIVIN